MLLYLSYPVRKCDHVARIITNPDGNANLIFLPLQIINNYIGEVKIFKDFHKNVIGKGGATIKKIRDETDTKIDLPSQGSSSDSITITGKKENVNKAIAMIEKIQTELVSYYQDVNHCCDARTGFLIKLICFHDCFASQIRCKSLKQVPLSALSLMMYLADF